MEMILIPRPKMENLDKEAKNPTLKTFYGSHTYPLS